MSVLRSFRREYLDDLLALQSNAMLGEILDIGGKRDGKRGEFRPPDTGAHWKYLNIAPETNPDFCCDAETIPVGNETFDVVVLCEVLEHLENPEKVLGEACRVLKLKGALLASIPFIFPYHSDPCDYQRWTSPKIKKSMSSAGFSEIAVLPMGGIVAVIHDLVMNYCGRSTGGIGSRIMRNILPSMRPILKSLDRATLEGDNPPITTGYFVIAKKK